MVSGTRVIYKAHCVSDFVPSKPLILSILCAETDGFWANEQLLNGGKTHGPIVLNNNTAHTTGGGPFDLLGSPFNVE